MVSDDGPFEFGEQRIYSLVFFRVPLRVHIDTTSNLSATKNSSTRLSCLRDPPELDDHAEPDRSHG